MINFLFFFIGCFTTKYSGIEYIQIGAVDRTVNGICIVEIDNKHQDTHIIEVIHIYSKKCKDGDIIALGRKTQGNK